jgi:outer membrane protein TolC
MPPAATPAPAVRAALLAVILTGCTVGPDFHAPDAPASTRFTEAALPDRTASAATPGGSAQALTPDRDIPGEWWALFHSPQITTLVTQALKANPDVAAAQATLLQARETRRAEQGTQLPQVSASVGVERQRESLAAFGVSPR